MITDILWRFLFLQTFRMGVFCSSCKSGPVQAHFCASQLVFTGEIIRPVNNEGPFKFRLIKLLKGEASQLNIAEGKIINVERSKKVEEVETKVSQFQGENKYVMFVFNMNGKVHADECYPILPFGFLTRFQKKALHSYYSGCPCMGKSGKQIGNPFCLDAYTYFVQEGRKCIWMKSPDFPKCNKLHYI